MSNINTIINVYVALISSTVLIAIIHSMTIQWESCEGENVRELPGGIICVRRENFTGLLARTAYCAPSLIN